MGLFKNKEFQKAFVLIIILLLVVGIFIVLRWQSNLGITKKAESPLAFSLKYDSNLSLDTKVLQEEKFKNLQAIPKLQLEQLTGEEVITSTELSQVRRRYGNPFKPF